MPDTDAQTVGNNETKILKMSDDPSLVNGQNGESVNTWMQNIHYSIHSIMKFGEFSPDRTLTLGHACLAHSNN